jgi:hypothetical protein
MLQRPQQQVTYGYLLAQSWYRSAQNRSDVLDLKHHFIFALESSPTLALNQEDPASGKSQALDALTFPDKQTLLIVRQVFTASADRNKDGSQGI